MTTAMQHLLDGNWMEFLFGWVGDTGTGEGAFAVFIVGMVVLPVYARTGSVALPAIALTLLSGSFIPLLPGALAGVAWGVLWIAGAVSIFGVVEVFR
jgi:hypothetical protein